MVGRKRTVGYKIDTMSINIDITDRMFAAFGYLPSGTPKRETIRAGIAAAYASDAAQNAGIGRANIALVKKHIGGNVFVADRCFADLTLKSTEDGTLYRFANTILGEKAEGVLAPPPMLSFQRCKQIVTTNVDGSDAVVVESFGAKPWEITIDGILVDTEEHHYPQEQLRKFRELFEVNAMFDVLDCEVLDDIGVRSLYIENLESLNFVEGYQDTVKYKLKAKSIQPVEFFI